MSTPPNPAAGQQAQAKTAVKPKPRIFYHCYFCPSLECLKSANPVLGAVHQRGVHLATDKPRTDVKCPGCGGAMVIARNGLTDELDKKNQPTGNKVPHPKGHIVDGPDGNAVLYGDPLIHEVFGQDDQSALIDAENAEAAK